MLDVYCSRMYSALITSASLIIMLCAVFTIVVPGSSIPLFIKIVMMLVAVASLWGLIAGVKRLVHPPLMFSADRRGIKIYFDSKTVSYTSLVRFLPWSIVSSLELKEVAVLGVRGRGRTWVIVCNLHTPASFPVKEHSIITDSSLSDMTVTLDALTGTVAKQELLDGLNKLRLSASPNRH